MSLDHPIFPPAVQRGYLGERQQEEGKVLQKLHHNALALMPRHWQSVYLHALFYTLCRLPYTSQTDHVDLISSRNQGQCLALDPAFSDRIMRVDDHTVSSLLAL